jgi:glycine cleavage system aminomethyltransferase T
MALEEQIAAIRTGVAWCNQPGVVAVSISGEDAFSLAERVSPIDPYVREGQVRPTLLLGDDGKVLADAYLGQDEDSVLLIVEGMSSVDLLSYLGASGRPSQRAHVEELTASHEVISVHGPYAWELIGELLGPELIGLPYLAFYRVGEVLCLRGGKTGEYGYDLLVPRGQAAALRARLTEVGAAFDLAEVGIDAVDQCMLENAFFNARREGRARLSPLELGLQWRVSYAREFVGSGALREERSRGAARRVTWLLSDVQLDEGAAVLLADASIGQIVAAGASPTLGGWVGIGVLERPYYHAGIDCFRVTSAAGRTPVCTVTPPVVNNRSMYVNPQRHAYSTRDDDALPALV